MDLYPWLNSLRRWDETIDTMSPLEVPRALLAYLGNPQDSFTSVHVGGTNGKGSTVAFIEQICRASNKYQRIASTVSPHLVDVEERLCINGVQVASPIFKAALLEVEAASSELNIEPTYFTAVIVASFVAMKNLEVDLGIVEVGMGGLLDATNVMKHSEVSVISSIGLDHQKFLGDTYAEIARNKAGIFKENGTAVIGVLPQEALEVIYSVAEEKHVTLTCLGRDVFFEYDENKSIVRVGDEVIDVPAPFAGYLAHNVALAVCVAQKLGIELHSSISFNPPHGRCETFILKNDKKVLIDGAHNSEGVAAFLKKLKSEISLSKSTSFAYCLIFLRRKNWKEMLSQVVKAPKAPIYILIDEDTVVEEEVREFLEKIHFEGSFSCISYVQITEIPEERIYCFGSLTKMGRVRNVLTQAI